ncbi:MRP-L47-domain-containing protein [Durotheca rogersii]|uniref:MRP-L47-domain-containing protein n=1 Tax=Durotheca rogersii TaxID=419775 RepID=UPI00221F66B9|nr:MRP-L47-domain-containing protein [Durotheca rogersii]KAI5868660.1 MRP-L47-domain-containing protein [Durotheca rogersii]
MATTAAVRPSVGRVLHAIANRHAANTAVLATLSVGPSPQSRSFSSTSERCMRKPRRDNNRLRGLSSIYRSGPRFRMNIGQDQIPQPVEGFKPQVKVDPNHGLWEFFYSKKKLLLTPEEDAKHGRAWSVEELRHKSWEDLHKLWWVCVKEQNRIVTAQKEKTRMRLWGGKEETAERLHEVRRTMQSIKHALTERFYLWEDARRLAETDPEIDLNSTDRPYNPSTYVDEVAATTEGSEAAQDGRESLPGPEEGPEEGPEGGSKASAAAEEVDPSTLPPPSSNTQQPSTRP